MSFEKFGLSPELLSGLADVRFEQPTPLQTEVLPAALQGKHILVKNEAGENGAFLIPALQTLAGNGNGEVFGTQVLILTPSIERAKELDELVWAMGYHAQISSALIAIKGDKAEQEKAVLDGAPVIIANPGRFIEILEKNNFQLPNLKLIVIDEAHNMENYNLVSRVKVILRFVVGEPQVIQTTGNHNNASKSLADFALKEPETFGFNGESVTESNTQEPVEVDLNEVKDKLEEAEVKVVLDPGSASENNDEDSSDATKDSDSGQKNDADDSDKEHQPEKAESDSGDAVEEKSEQVEPADLDMEQVESKLAKTGVKVVLKKYQIEDVETEKSDDVEPVYANPVLQGEADVPDGVPKALEQGYINVPPRMKISTLMAHLEESKAKKVMVFAASKRTTDRLFRIIRKKNWGVVSISDSIDEDTYKERFARFTSGEMRVLLVGGMKANEVEIEKVEEVINYDVPDEVNEYRYRAELVGNKKASRIISLVSKMDRDDIKQISEEVGYPPTELPLPEEVSDKKQNKSSGKGKSSKNNRKKSSRSKPRNNNKSRRNNKPKRRQPKDLELPRPTYDGLSGGREGSKKEEESSGLFGWVKKIFN